MIINKNVMMIVAIVVVMMIAVTTIEVMRVAMTIVVVAMMVVHDHTHDLITNTMIVDTNKSEMTEDKHMSGHVHSRSVNRPDWFRLPLKKIIIE